MCPCDATEQPVNVRVFTAEKATSSTPAWQCCSTDPEIQEVRGKMLKYAQRNLAEHGGVPQCLLRQ